MAESKSRSFVDDLMARETDAMPRWLAVGTRIGQFAFQVASQFGRDQGFARASGMAYVSLLAIVPATAVFFAVFARFADMTSILADLQETIVQYVVPTSSDTIQEFLQTATEKTRALGLVGTAFLFVTTVLLFNAIEGAFNHIFHTRRRRSSVIKILVFTSVLVWGPLLMGLSVWATGQLKQLVNVDIVMNDSTALSRIVYYLTPLVLTWAAFTGAFMIIPAARVRIRSALVGGLVAGVFFELAKLGFPAYVKKAVAYSTIYGSLSVIPFFLIWLWATWLIALIGLEVTYTHQNFHILMAQLRWAEPPRGKVRIQLALRLFGEVAGAFERGAAPPPALDLAERLAVPGEVIEDLLADLERADLVRQVANETEGYVPGRALAVLPVYELVRAVHDGEGLPATGERDSITARMDALVERLEKGAASSVEGLTVADLVDASVRSGE